MKIAFYAPMRPVSAPGTSGDRGIARMLWRGLEAMGHEVIEASTLTTWRKDPLDLTPLRAAAEAEADRLLADLPDLFFTYHNYYKAPDLIGPLLADAGVPYVIAEASDAPSRENTPWADGLRAARDATAAAGALLGLSDRDRPALEAKGWGPKLIDLPLHVPLTAPARGGPGNLIAVGMTREGAKLQSYRTLASALAGLPADWHLTIIGDGPARGEVEAAFVQHKDRVTFKGALPPGEVTAALACAGTFIWPGHGEGLGLVYLEAMAAGLACIALDEPGPRAALGDAGVLASPASLPTEIGRVLTDRAYWQALKAKARQRAATEITRARFETALITAMGRALK